MLRCVLPLHREQDVAIGAALELPDEPKDRRRRPQRICFQQIENFESTGGVARRKFLSQVKNVTESDGLKRHLPTGNRDLTRSNYPFHFGTLKYLGICY